VLERIGARRVLIVAALATAVIVGTVAASNLASSTVYYLTPSEAMARNIPTGQTVRLGGLVRAGSLSMRFVSFHGPMEFEFVITDGNVDVRVLGRGAIPGLLREGAGAVVEGSFAADGTFLATQVIAKHDEVYTAPKTGQTPPHRTSLP
jgi:cytochrome c-type biogenesis protein CcmE